MTTRHRQRIRSDDQYHLKPHERRQLSEWLTDDIPALATQLGVAITLQARLEQRVPTLSSTALAEMRPYDIDAATTADELHDTLARWVRTLCRLNRREFIPIGYTHPAGFIGPLGEDDVRAPHTITTSMLSIWLYKHLNELALLPSAPRAYEAIHDKMLEARRIVCPPVIPIRIDKQRVAAARARRLNARGIATLARELGDEYRHLTVRRIRTLRERGLIREVPGRWWVDDEDPEQTRQYIVGDVLDAHLKLPIRRRDTRRD